MGNTKSPRQLAWEGLERLIAAKVDKTGPLGEIFHYGILAPKGRDPKNDLPSALVATAIVEQALEHALVSQFKKRNKTVVRDCLFDGRGAPMRDLSSKITLAYLTGVIGAKTRSDLSAIRRIRNAFAHTRLKVNFDTPEIVEACRQISLPRRWEKMMADNDRDNMREIFIQTCFEFSVWLFTYDDRHKIPKQPHKPPHDHLGE